MQNIRAHETRKQLFSANASRDNPFQHPTKPITEPPPWSNSSNVSASMEPTVSVILSKLSYTCCVHNAIAYQYITTTISSIASVVGFDSIIGLFLILLCFALQNTIKWNPGRESAQVIFLTSIINEIIYNLQGKSSTHYYGNG